MEPHGDSEPIEDEKITEAKWAHKVKLNNHDKGSLFIVASWRCRCGTAGAIIVSHIHTLTQFGKVGVGALDRTLR